MSNNSFRTGRTKHEDAFVKELWFASTLDLKSTESGPGRQGNVEKFSFHFFIAADLRKLDSPIIVMDAQESLKHPEVLVRVHRVSDFRQKSPVSFQPVQSGWKICHQFGSWFAFYQKD